MNRIILFSTLLMLYSCSFFNSKVESIVNYDKNNSIKEKEYSTKLTQICYPKNSIEIIVEEESVSNFYNYYFQKLFNNKDLSFIQKAIVLSLLEMQRRPDRVSPFSRLQIYLKLNQNEGFLDFRPLDLESKDAAAFIKGLDYLIKQEKKYKNLAEFTKFIDPILNSPIVVSSEFETFLKENKKEILKSTFFSDFFIKGDDVITRHETFQNQNLFSGISYFTKKNFLLDSLYQTPSIQLQFTPIKTSNTKVKCNVDLEKDFDANEIINNSNNNSHYFGLKIGSNIFIATTNSFLVRPIQNLETFLYIKAQAYPTALPICQIKNDQKNLVLFSTKGRSPSQHIKHLLSYEIQNTETFSELSEILNFSRHLFLPNPDRILYESKRGRKSQLDFFLSKNFPIYHVDKLGNILGFASFNSQTKNAESIVLDTRSSNILRCEE